MRKIKTLLSIILSTLFLLSCTTEVDNGENFEPEKIVKGTTLSMDDAMDNVYALIGKLETVTRSGKQKKIANGYTSGGFGATRSGDIEEPLVYIFNFENDEGYAIASGDTRTPTVFAITDNGSLEQGAVVDNPGLIIFLANADVEYRMMVGLPVTNDDGEWVDPIGMTEEGLYVYPDMINNNGGIVEYPLPFPDDRGPDGDGGGGDSFTYTYSAWKNYSTRGTIIPCNWGQGFPYNNYCFTSNGDKAPAGCVATAVAQIMFYWGKNHTFESYYFNWSLMRQHTGTISHEPAHDMISELFFKLGRPNNLNMNYKIDASGAYGDKVPRTFVNFGYTSGGTYVGYDFDKINNIISGRPVYVDGYAKKKVTQYYFMGIKTSKDTYYSGGHAWVVDQVLTRVRDRKYYINGVYQNTTKEYEQLVHCNFGWDGGGDGYYYSGKFNTNKGPETRTQKTYWYGESYYYQYNLRMNIGIYP